MKKVFFCSGSYYAVSMWLVSEAPPCPAFFQSALEPHRVDTCQTRQAWLHMRLIISQPRKIHIALWYIIDNQWAKKKNYTIKDCWLDKICPNPGLNQGLLSVLSNALRTELFQLLIHHCPVHQTSGSFNNKGQEGAGCADIWACWHCRECDEGCKCL